MLSGTKHKANGTKQRLKRRDGRSPKKNITKI